MHVELEWKFEATPGLLEMIKEAFPGEYRTITMETTYFDTPERDLSTRKWTLRHRLENGEGVTTLKTPAEGQGRNEYEAKAETLLKGVGQLLDQGAPKELGTWTRAAAPICGAAFTREAVELEFSGTVVELALDQGKLRSGDGMRERLFAEAEVEFKSGDELVAGAFAKGLAARYGMTPQPLSKFARALRLSEGR